MNKDTKIEMLKKENEILKEQITNLKLKLSKSLESDDGSFEDIIDEFISEIKELKQMKEVYSKLIGEVKEELEDVKKLKMRLTGELPWYKKII